MQTTTIQQLTFSNTGHTLHHNNVFSSDGKYLVFDGRNDETKIGETSFIGLLNLETGEESIVYKCANSTIYGPGVGAASFSPVADLVIFIHGLEDATKEKPYAVSRRTGMLVSLVDGQASYADSRHIYAPYCPGSLRGGTHSHAWSPIGDFLSFTYNDEAVEAHLRTVGVMFPHPLGDHAMQHCFYNAKRGQNQRSGNIAGTYYAAIVSEVVSQAAWGTDDIERAFDECWLKHTSSEAQGELRHSLGLVFQGNTRNRKGKLVTELFYVAIDKEVILADQQAVGDIGERPRVPKGVKQRRITYSERGISTLRHWLRASNDGRYIYALGEDDYGNNQLMQCEFSSGKLVYLTNFDFSISSPINLSANSKEVAFFANNQVYRYGLATGELEQLTNFENYCLVGAPVYAPDGRSLVFNVLLGSAAEAFTQIYRISF